eukprot:m.28220 g.28220  ORF g.28220 m.28220 type:complete len:357 (+) comp10415_c0_seq1:93-1163(+)
MVLRVGIMSTAQIAGKVVEAIGDAKGVRVTAVSSRFEEKAKEFAENYDIPKAYGSYDEMLEDHEIDAVYIPLPSGMHGEWVIKTAKAGKHILCDKPTAKSADDLQKMLEACRDNNVLWMDGVMFMHHDRTPRILEEIKMRGPVEFVHSAFSFSAGEDFFSDNIRMHKELEPFAVIGDLGWYNIRAAMMAFNWEAPERVSAIIHRRAGPEQVASEVTGTLMWKNNRVSTFLCSFHHAFRQTLEMVGSWGLVRLDDIFVAREIHGTEFDVYTNTGHSEDHRTMSESRTNVTMPACYQVQNMWERFARLAKVGREESDKSDNVLETWKFWSRVSLINQAVMDACSESASHDGKIVEVKI